MSEKCIVIYLILNIFFLWTPFFYIVCINIFLVCVYSFINMLCHLFSYNAPRPPPSTTKQIPFDLINTKTNGFAVDWSMHPTKKKPTTITIPYPLHPTHEKCTVFWLQTKSTEGRTRIESPLSQQYQMIISLQMASTRYTHISAFMIFIYFFSIHFWTISSGPLYLKI